jgi:hypothetical protein
VCTAAVGTQRWWKRWPHGSERSQRECATGPARRRPSFPSPVGRAAEVGPCRVPAPESGAPKPRGDPVKPSKSRPSGGPLLHHSTPRNPIYHKMQTVSERAPSAPSGSGSGSRRARAQARARPRRRAARRRGRAAGQPQEALGGHREQAGHEAVSLVACRPDAHPSAVPAATSGRKRGGEGGGDLPPGIC